MLVLLTVFSLSFLTCDGGNSFEEVFGEEEVVTPETAAATCSTDSSLCVWTEDFTTVTTPVDNVWYFVKYANGLFVAVAKSGTGNRVMTSPDGINWTIRTSAADYGWYGVTYGNGLFVGVATTGVGNRAMVVQWQ